MGGDMLSSLGIEYEGLECCQRVTTCEDTKRCAGIYKKLGVDLVVFAVEMEPHGISVRYSRIRFQCWGFLRELRCILPVFH